MMTPEMIADSRLRRYNATVAALAKPNPELMIVRIRTDFPKPAHRAGQYTTLGLGMWEPRIPGCQQEQRHPGAAQRHRRHPLDRRHRLDRL